MTTTTDSRMTDKTTLIERLLAKAESTTPEEAEALTAAAERLMVKHGIDAAMLAAKRKEGEPEKIITESVQFTGTYAHGELFMASAVVQAFGTMRVYKSGTGANLRLNIVGFESDVAQTKTLLASLTIQSVVAMRAWWKANRDDYGWYTESEKRNVRRQFIVSFGQGAAERIKAATSEILNETAEEGTSNALVLVDRKSQVDDHLAADPNLKFKKSRGIRGGGRSAHEAGVAAGRVANTGGKAVGSTKALGR